MTVKEAKEALKALQRKMTAYNHAQELIYYDGCTTAPKGTAENRSNSLSVLSEESYKLCTCKETVDLLNCETYFYEGYSHKVYEEAPDFKEMVYNFFIK